MEFFPFELASVWVTSRRYIGPSLCSYREVFHSVRLPEAGSSLNEWSLGRLMFQLDPLPTAANWTRPWSPCGRGRGCRQVDLSRKLVELMERLKIIVVARESLRRHSAEKFPCVKYNLFSWIRNNNQMGIIRYLGIRNDLELLIDELR